MGMYKISPKAWRRASDVLLWYPDTKQEYESAVQEAMSRNPKKSGPAGKPLYSDPTASAAIKLVSNKRVQQMAREIAAVEEALRDLTGPEMAVIRKRFWTATRKGRRKPMAYIYINGTGYEERQQKRIVQRVIFRVAVYLGEI